MLQKGYVSIMIMDAVESCGEKCANLYRVYKPVSYTHLRAHET